MTHAPKNIVICLDGTGNRFDEHNTNVVKLFRVLERKPDQQLAYYDPGVGTLAEPGLVTPIGKKLNRLLGLAFGRGVSRNITEAYTYLMNTYQPGDQVFIFGFSRGAYTCRALAGFIHRCGLLEAGAENLLPYALKIYKKADFAIAGRFKKTYARTCPIHFLGLWDTVKSVGWVYDPVSLPNTANNPSVAIVRHALALDERRVFYRHNAWGHRDRAKQDVKEVWFPGVHSDVGGGYPEPESGLAKIALDWMLREATEAGLLVDSATVERIVHGKGTTTYVGPDHRADAHRSLAGLWWPVELLPIRGWDTGRQARTWRLPRPARPRTLHPDDSVHQSVLDRIRDRNEQPANLADPSAFTIET